MFRRLSYGFLTFLLPVALFSSMFMLAVIMTLGTPKHIESALDKSGIYTTALDSALDESGDKKDPGEDVPLSDPGVKTVIKQTFPPDRIQTYAENVIDGTYAWIQGKTAKPSFSLDFAQIETDLAANLSAYAQQRLTALPVCAKGVVPTDVDPYSATCVPKGFDVAAASQKVSGEILGSDDFLKQTTYTVDDFKNDQGKPVVDDYKAVPQAYRGVVTALWINSLLAVAAIVGVILLGTTKRSGTKRVSIVAIVVGAVLLLIGLGTRQGLTKLSEEVAKGDGSQALQQSIAAAANDLGAHLYQWWLGVGALLVLIGVGLLVWLKVAKSEAAESPKPTAAKTPSTPPAPAAAPKKTTKK